MASEILYSDKLVEITQDSIRFRNYYFPFGSKRVAFKEVGGVAVTESVGIAEKWRIQGTMDFITWFPRDWRRPTRDRIYILSFPNKRRRIGFTVEDSHTVTNLLIDKGLL